MSVLTVLTDEQLNALERLVDETGSWEPIDGWKRDIIRWLEKEPARRSHPLAPKCAASKRSIK